MAKIVLFPIDSTAQTETGLDVSSDQFLLEEGLELLADFRAIRNCDVRASLRGLVKSMAIASNTTASAGD